MKLFSNKLKVCLLFVLLILISIAGKITAFATKPLSVKEHIIFEVFQGDSVQSISQRLAQKGILSYPRLFSGLARCRGLAKKIQVGEYEIKSGQTPWALLDQMALGVLKQYRITFLEGMTFSQILSLLHAEPKIQKTLNAQAPAEILDQLELKNYTSPEGLFYPETYYFTKNTKDITILKRAHQALKQVIEPLWANRDATLPFEDWYDALIVASIVQKETKFLKEFPMISGVYIRRLQKNMYLQADPTVIYGLGDNFTGSLSRSNLLQDTPYNTYTRKGLPKTPIALSGLLALKAVFHPDQSANLYFVANGKGGHFFSENLSDHKKSVLKYRALQQAIQSQQVQ